MAVQNIDWDYIIQGLHKEGLLTDEKKRQFRDLQDEPGFGWYVKQWMLEEAENVKDDELRAAIIGAVIGG